MGWGLSVKVVINTTEFPIIPQHPASPHPAPFLTCLSGGALPYSPIWWVEHRLTQPVPPPVDVVQFLPQGAGVILVGLLDHLPSLSIHVVQDVLMTLDPRTQILQHIISYEHLFTAS